MTDNLIENLVSDIKSGDYLFDNQNHLITSLESYSLAEQCSIFFEYLTKYPKDAILSLQSLFQQKGSTLFEQHNNCLILNKETIDFLAQQKDFLSFTEKCSCHKVYMDEQVLHHYQKEIDYCINNVELASHYKKVSPYVFSMKKVEVNISFYDKLKSIVKKIEFKPKQNRNDFMLKGAF